MLISTDQVERLREEVSQKDESLRYVTSEVEEMRRAMQEDTDIKVAEVERRLNREHEKVRGHCVQLYL